MKAVFVGRDVMNPILFPCSHCSHGITVPPEAVGKAVPCPNCKQAILVPTLQASNTTPNRIPSGHLAGAPTTVAGRDQGPDFTETLRKARESTDSIFNDQDDDGDSLFGSNAMPRKPIVPISHASSTTPTVLTDSSQATLRIPGLPEVPALRSAPSPPTTTRSSYLPSPAPLTAAGNPFEDLTADFSLEDSGNMQPSGAMEEEELENPESNSFPVKNLLILGLAIYAAIMTAVALWGWLRIAPANGSNPPAVNNRR